MFFDIQFFFSQDESHNFDIKIINSGKHFSEDIEQNHKCSASAHNGEKNIPFEKIVRNRDNDRAQMNSFSLQFIFKPYLMIFIFQKYEAEK